MLLLAVMLATPDRGEAAGSSGGRTVVRSFNVYDGQIHAVEALMEQMPRGSSSGWGDRGVTR